MAAHYGNQKANSNLFEGKSMHKIGLALVLALCCLTANGATFTLAGDSGLTGSVVIDTTTGLVTSVNVTYAGDTFQAFNGPYFLGSSVVHIQAINAGGTKLLHLLLASSSLIGFTGATFCGTEAPCGGAVSEVYCITCGIGQLVQFAHVTLT